MQPQSYKIMTDKGTIMRNRQHLLLTRETFEESGTTDEDSIISPEETEIRTSNCPEVNDNVNNENADEEIVDQSTQHDGSHEVITTRPGKIVHPSYLNIYKQ